MRVNEIKQYVVDFRSAIDSAKASGLFKNHPLFSHFPKRSCLIASELLAEFLCRNGIDTIIVQGSGSYVDGTHAWLAINDDGYQPTQIEERFPNDAYEALQRYNPSIIADTFIRNEYDTDIIWKMDIVDVTIDQFGIEAPYIGKPLKLHKRYSIRSEMYNGQYDTSLYSIISNWL